MVTVTFSFVGAVVLGKRVAAAGGVLSILVTESVASELTLPATSTALAYTVSFAVRSIDAL
ncbi:hypothetical protein D3C72_2446370 [compost metagenome]